MADTVSQAYAPQRTGWGMLNVKYDEARNRRLDFAHSYWADVFPSTLSAYTDALLDPQQGLDRIVYPPSGDGRRIAGPNVARFVQDFLPAPPPEPSAEIKVLERWDGVVVALHRESGVFEGQFVPEGQATPRYRADFLIEEIDEDDQELIALGALFSVTYGRMRVSSRRWQPTSRVRFRRIPPLRPDDLEAAYNYAAKMRAKITS